MAALLGSRPRLMRVALSVAVGVGMVALLVGVVTARSNGRSRSGRPTVAPAAGRAGVDAAGETEPQALVAGVGDATLMARLFPLDPVAAELVPLQRQVAGLVGQPIYRQVVLAAHVGSYAPPRAEVAAWVMLTAGQARVADNATATFATVTVELVFEHGAWKLDHTSEQPGPSPEVRDAPTSVDSLISRLDGFADWRPAS